MNKTNPIDFNNLYKTYYVEAINYANNKTHNILVSEEVVNDSFIKAYKNLISFDPNKACFKTWLFTIINNTIIDNYRKTNKHDIVYSIDNINDEGKQIYQHSYKELTPLEILNNNEIYDKVIKSINNLNNDNLKNIATLYFINGLNYNEICETLDITLPSVKGCIFRIRIKLQKELYIFL